MSLPLVSAGVLAVLSALVYVLDAPIVAAVWALASVTCLGTLLLDGAGRISACLTVIAMVAASYFAQLAVMPKRNTIRRAAEAAGRPYDPRSRSEVLNELRSRGLAAVPAMHGRAIDSLSVGDLAVVPLAGVADRPTVMCNETGEYAIYRSDRYGFNNPDSLWNEPVALAAVGDSYTHGWCVPPDSTIVAALREAIPQSVSLGMGGNGPLIELATLKEYGTKARPRIALWMYYENDLSDLAAERSNPILLRYLQPGYRVDHPGMQMKLDSSLAAALEALNPEPEGEPRRRGMSDSRLLSKVRQIITLQHVRSVLGAATGLGERRAECCDLELFESVLREAARSVAGWNGALYFVFLPARERYSVSPPRQVGNVELAARDQVLEAARRAGVEIIDLHPSFERLDDPGTLFVYPGSHYSALGYRFVAARILERLDALRALETRRLDQRPHDHSNRPR